MALVAPFKAVTYNPAKINNLADVIIPPYDVIPKGDEDKYRNRHPYNLANILLSKGPDDDYSSSDQLLKKWMETGILVEDHVPHFYVYEQDFSVEGQKHSRRTLMAQVGLRDFSEGVICPHERTHGKHKADRLKILSKTQMNLSHVFGMVKDQEGFLAERYEEWCYRPPLFTATFDDGVKHSLWRIDPSNGKAITQFFEHKPIYIVDGHHRYESSLAYARNIGALGNVSHPANYMLFAISNTYDSALVVFPTHRWVKAADINLSRSEVEKVFHLTATKPEAIFDFIKKTNDEPRFGLYAWGETFLAAPHNWHKESGNLGAGVAQLAVTWSDEFLLRQMGKIEPEVRSQKIVYEKNALNVWEQKGPSDVIIFHAPPPIEAITRVSDEKGFMPQKSTYFYPKLFAGLTLRKAW